MCTGFSDAFLGVGIVLLWNGRDFFFVCAMDTNAQCGRTYAGFKEILFGKVTATQMDKLFFETTRKSSPN